MSKEAEAIRHATNHRIALEHLKRLVNQHSDCYAPIIQLGIADTETLFERAKLAEEEAGKVCMEELEKFNTAR